MGDDEGLRAVRERVETLRRPEPAAMAALVDALRLTDSRSSDNTAIPL